MIRVLIADDEQLVCTFLHTILDSASDIEVVGQALDGTEAVGKAQLLRPDVVLMDIRMPGTDGIAATKQIVDKNLATAVIVLTTFDSDANVLKAMHAGAKGFLLKSTDPDDLVNLVRVAARGHVVLSAQSSAHLLAPALAVGDLNDQIQQRLSTLSARETTVVAMIAQGRTNADIARSLSLSEATIKGYVSKILTKCDCTNRTQLGLLAFAAGLGESSR